MGSTLRGFLFLLLIVLPNRFHAPSIQFVNGDIAFVQKACNQTSSPNLCNDCITRDPRTPPSDFAFLITYLVACGVNQSAAMMRYCNYKAYSTKDAHLLDILHNCSSFFVNGTTQKLLKVLHALYQHNFTGSLTELGIAEGHTFACLDQFKQYPPQRLRRRLLIGILELEVSATKEAWDDYNRYLSDKQANEKEVWVIQAQDIRVGNIVWLRDNDEVPCDLVLIGTSDPQGVCYIEGVIECPNPDKDIRRFDANLRLFPPFIDNDLCPLTINNTLLQSCYLRNTEWACGVAVYTGDLADLDQHKLMIRRGKTIIPENTRRGSTNAECYKCHERGHYAYQCPKSNLHVGIERGLDANAEDEEFNHVMVLIPKRTPMKMWTLPSMWIVRIGFSENDDNGYEICFRNELSSNETKLGMSRGIPEPKLTAMDAMIDKLTGAIFVFQIVVVIVLGIAGNVWKDTEAIKVDVYKQQWYVLYPNEGPWYELLVIPLRFELLCSIMIPISIKVSLDLVKSLYAKFIDWDKEMYDHETSTPSHATNTAISEDLGQVEYILTDKTGTLTENKMIFRRCCIKGIFYGNESGDAMKDVELLDAVASNSPDVNRFLTVMAICNTVIPMKSKSGAISYKAQSQDEDALVHAAACLHMVLVNKNANILEINFNASVIQYEILDTLEFTSDRKRMSVVVKDCQNGKIFLLSKGADEAILPCACSGQQIRTFIEAAEQYSQLGLRTLCLAWRELEEDEYREWSLMFKEANSTLVDREWRLAEACQRLEHDLEILGVTAIEDRLQDGVPETIETLRKAGINFWMLTGDKQNTAIQIALSCNFISPEPKGHLLLINGKTEDEVSRSLERVLLTMRITTSEHKDVAFVVDGWALEIALKHYRETFTELAILSRTAICCRVTPSQKAQRVVRDEGPQSLLNQFPAKLINSFRNVTHQRLPPEDGIMETLVELLKSCDYRTLAIGDGGNDVRMIQQADIGVGISGREGLQAARAADYSIGKFRYLKRLILVHGRYSYNRTAFLSQYSFYKSLLICFIQIL
ncbi:hypothetical protein HHK36_005285 [Tetracentron sinense]|uniref:CCHC-type domain-containing protein n=1 Tax=Tetracentron sinense TaxID=13715 RepID=A0A834ZL67_TETSI|nr:hypothetical protein HHK36_005285 [Tetracentron sinense]